MHSQAFLKIVQSIPLFLAAIFVAPHSYAQAINVIALEYPPYLTENQPEHGTAYDKLAQVFIHSPVSIHPQFLSPARAHNRVDQGQWCLSFYPPITPGKDHVLVPLLKEKIELKLFRLAEPEVFIGNELSGKVVAQLRMQMLKGVAKEFVDAGAKLVLVDTLEQGVNLLLKNRVDYVYGDMNAIYYATEKIGFPSALIQDSALVLRSFPIGVWVNKQCEDSNFALSQLKRQGFRPLKDLSTLMATP
ncbi:type 2 periplasmic-binding domain-containing protein [Shewanella subflava]|uniref:Solute-binding protein family 3/N-terminal domain-containing protein n=1 Tax=Shewanella subflava TaxID=2986476 RepID=A0ABT3I7Q2_9GAMM|nr:hypothetical protein [Shewanella subflava]MCW3172082.1 hypothetical protein [Shewanella subflava]